MPNLIDNLDVIVRWEFSKRDLSKFDRTGVIDIMRRPLSLRCPDGIIELAIPGIGIVRKGRVSEIRGTAIIAKLASVRPVDPPHPIPKNIWHPQTTFLYFDSKTGDGIVVGKRKPFRSASVSIEKVKRTPATKFTPYYTGIKGMAQEEQEKKLVREYIIWVGANARLVPEYRLSHDRLRVDLFNFTHWQLIEAKWSLSREDIRYAMGQLMDYKRYFPRRPSLAVLLPERPVDSIINLLTDNRIDIIWQTPGGRFGQRRWRDIKR